MPRRIPPRSAIATARVAPDRIGLECRDTLVCVPRCRHPHCPGEVQLVPTRIVLPSGSLKPAVSDSPVVGGCRWADVIYGGYPSNDQPTLYSSANRCESL